MTVLEQNDYYPFGLRHPNASLKTTANRYRYNGKEEIAADATSDYGARQYSAEFCQWLQVDPLSEKFYSTSPYGFCAGNPLRFVDPDGLAWRPTFYVNGLGDKKINGYEWVDPEESYDIQGNLLEGLYEAVVWFQGSEDERLGEDGKMTGKGANPAQVTIYGINGEDDISTYRGMTTPKNSEFSTLNEGDYLAYYQDMATSPYGEAGALLRGIPTALTYQLKSLDGKTPLKGMKKGQEVTMKDVFFHRTDWDGTARNASKDCPTIDGRQWRNVEKQLGKSSNIELIVNYLCL